MGVYLCTCLCACVNEWVRVCVCEWEWVEAPGQAIRYWCSCLRVCRGKWMCVYVGVCSCSLVCARSCVHVCVQGVMLCRQTAAGERWPALIWSVICWSRCTAASSSQFLSLNFTVKSLLRFSLSLFVFFLLFPCFFLKNVLKFAFLSRFQKQLFLFFCFSFYIAVCKVSLWLGIIDVHMSCFLCPPIAWIFCDLCRSIFFSVIFLPILPLSLPPLSFSSFH